MAWETSNRRDRLPPEWPIIRKRILARDGGRCTWVNDDGLRCQEQATDVDHIKPGDDHSDHNLRSLCRWHHARKSSGEGAAAALARRREIHSRFRRHEEDPAFIPRR